MFVTPAIQSLILPVLVLLSGIVWGVIAGVLWERDRKRDL